MSLEGENHKVNMIIMKIMYKKMQKSYKDNSNNGNKGKRIISYKNTNILLLNSCQNSA